LVARTWGWFGHFASEVRLPTWIVVAASAIVVAGVVGCLWWGSSVQRRFAVLTLVGLAACVGAVGSAARRIHVEHGLNNAIQGRYLFATLPGVLVTAVVGWSHLVARLRSSRRVRRGHPVGWGFPAVAVVGAAVMQCCAAVVVLDGYWGAPRASGIERLRAMLAWSPAPRWLVGTIVVVTVGAVAWSLWLVASVARTWPHDAASPSR
jgi:hypothetical protein